MYGRLAARALLLKAALTIEVVMLAAGCSGAHLGSQSRAGEGGEQEGTLEASHFELSIVKLKTQKCATEQWI